MSNSEEKQIMNLKKQNEGMETSFQTKGINFTKVSIDDVDPETELLLLKNYNNYLKGISAANRPPAPVKEEKSKVIEVKPKEEKPKEEKPDDDDDEPIKEVKPVFSTITNMEDIKRAFFSKDYDAAYELIKQHPFKFYKANYKYADDNTGRPSFVAKNLLRGFVQSLDDYRKYLMVGFRCISIEEKKYNYPSYWIVNSNDDLKTILGSIYDDFDFIPVIEEEKIVRMYKRMQKNDSERENDEALIGEVYLH
jgi:hypothetical protein